MEKKTYDGASLERACVAFERRYGLSSEDFHAARVSGAELPEIPRFEQHVWASFYRDSLELREPDEGFADDVTRALALAR